MYRRLNTNSLSRRIERIWREMGDVLPILGLTQWLFKDPNTSTQAVDKTGANTYPIREGRVYNFDGAGDYVSLPDNVITADGQTFRIRFKYNSTGTMYILNQGSATAYPLAILLSSNKVYYSKASGAGNVYANDVNLTSGTWYDLELTTAANIADFVLKIDGGVVAVSQLGSAGPSGSTNDLGSRGTALYFDGSMYGLESDGVPVHKMDEEAGTVAFNSLGNGNNGTINTADINAFHAIDKDVCKSWANDVGYSFGANKLSISSTVTGWTQQLTSLSLSDFKSNGDWALRQTNSDTTTSVHRSYSNNITGFTQGDWVVVFIKNNNSRYASWRITGGLYMTFDFQTEAVTAKSAQWTNVSVTKEGEWYKVVGKHDFGFSNAVIQIANDAVYNFPSGPDSAFTPINTTNSVDWFIGVTSTSDERVAPTFGSAISGVIIPRNEATTTQDVLGNALQYTGRVKYNDDVVASPCGNFDGAVDKITFSDLTGVSITSFQGTATPTIVGNEIQCTAGTLYNLVLSNGWHFPFTEKSGLTIHNKADVNNPGTLVTSDAVAFWSQTQNVYHDYLLNGGSRGARLVGGTPSLSNVPSSFVEGDVWSMKIKTTDTKFVLMWASSPNYAIVCDTTLVDALNHASKIVVDGVEYTSLTRLALKNLITDGDFHDIAIHMGSNYTSWTIVNFGGYPSVFNADNVDIYDVKLNGVLIDQPYIPALSDGSGNDCLGNSIQFPAGNHWNYPPSLLKAPEAPALTCPFVHGGTFDGSTHRLSVPTVTLSGDFKITYFLYLNSTNVISMGDVANNFIHHRSNKQINFRIAGANTSFATPTITLGDLKKYEFIRVGGDISLYIDGVFIENKSLSGSMVIDSIGARTGGSFYVDGRMSGVKVVSDGLTVVDEPLNGTLNNATLTGSADTFWVEEHHNLMFDSSGNALNFDPADLGANYLGLNREFADVSDPTKIKNLVVYEDPLTGLSLDRVLKYTNQ